MRRVIEASGAIQGQFLRSFLAQLAHQSAADEPGQRLNEKIARQVHPLLFRPVLHGLMASHRWQFRVVENETRGAVREPADIFKRQAKETLFCENQMFVEFSADRMDPCKNNALRWL